MPPAIGIFGSLVTTIAGGSTITAAGVFHLIAAAAPSYPQATVVKKWPRDKK